MRRLRFKILWTKTGCNIFRANLLWWPEDQAPFNTPWALWATVVNNVFKKELYKIQ